MPRTYNQTEVLKMERINKHIENATYLKFLKEVRAITYRRFVKSSRRSKLLAHLSDEIHNCKKNSKLANEEDINPLLVAEKERELQASITELRQLETQVCDYNNFDYGTLLSDDLTFTESDIERVLED